MTLGRGQSPDELFEAYGRVTELDFDDAFAEHMAEQQRGYQKHRVSEQEIREVLTEAPGFLRTSESGARLSLCSARHGRVES